MGDKTSFPRLGHIYSYFLHGFLFTLIILEGELKQTIYIVLTVNYTPIMYFFVDKTGI